MKRSSRHIVLMLFALAIVVGCGRKARLIPKGKLVDIYADMYMADQWMLLHPEMMRQADSFLVYAPIIEKYGYTLEDYRYSVDHYLLDPERFAKIITKSADDLKDLATAMDKEARGKDYWAKLLEKMDGIKPAYQIYDSLFVGALDTYKVDIQMDSMSRYVAHKVLPLWVPNGPGLIRKDKWLKEHEVEDTVANVNVSKTVVPVKEGVELEHVEVEDIEL